MLNAAQVVGEVGLGEFVNRFQRGSLVMKLPDTEAARIPTVLFGTVNGAIGVVASLPKDRFEFLWRLQARPPLLAWVPAGTCLCPKQVLLHARAAAWQKPMQLDARGCFSVCDCLLSSAC